MVTSGITLTLIIIIFTCLISYQAFNNQGMRNKFLFHPASVFEFGQYYRFLTSGFLHGSFLHLGVNMFVLWQFGESLEKFFMAQFGAMIGRVAYLLLYLGAIIFGSIPLFIKHKNNQYYSALGASGGVSGVLFALMVVAPWSMINFIFLPFLDIPFIIFGVLYLVYEQYQSKKGGGRIAHDAHIWGALFGVIAMIGLLYFLRPDLLNILWTRFLEGPQL